MAEPPNLPNQGPGRDRGEPDKPDKPNRRKLADLAARFLTRKWLAVILGVSVVIHAVGFSFYKLRARAPKSPPDTEVSLGNYRFVAARPTAGQVAEARFSLHLALLEEVDRPARQRLEAHAFRVQQEIEQLLRQAHGEDFDDPMLLELKRQLQEQINHTIGLRAVAEVIITDLQTEREADQPAPVAETVGSFPGADRPAG